MSSDEKLKEYSEIVMNVGKRLIDEYKEKRCVSGGINGPYNDPETPVRNLCHLIVITAIEITSFDKADYMPLIKEMSDQLLSYMIAPGLFVMREKKGKDRSNGTIGHSWVIEALVYLYKVNPQKDYLELMRQIIMNHKYNTSLHLYCVPKYSEIEDDVIDFTLNHQLWFAASVAEANCFLNDDYIRDSLRDFIVNLKSNMEIHKKGLICHPIYKRESYIQKIRQNLRKSIDGINRVFGKPSYQYREEGYHIFNIMAFARLKHVINDINIEEFKKINKAVCYVNTEYCLESLENKEFRLDNTIDYSSILPQNRAVNIYGYPYNVSGLEMMYIAETFPDLIDNSIAVKYLERQFGHCYESEYRSFRKGCHDDRVIDYRIYEYYRFLESSGERV